MLLLINVLLAVGAFTKLYEINTQIVAPIIFAYIVIVWTTIYKLEKR